MRFGRRMFVVVMVGLLGACIRPPRQESSNYPPLPDAKVSQVALQAVIPGDRLRELADAALPRILVENEGGKQPEFGVYRHPDPNVPRSAWPAPKITADNGRLGVNYPVYWRAKEGIFASCGYGDAGLASFLVGEIGASAALTVDVDWTLVPIGPAFNLDLPQQCRVTFLNIPINGYLHGRASAYSGQIVSAITAFLAQIPTRAAVTNAWDAAQQPIPLGSEAWLLLTPQSIDVPVIAISSDSLKVLIHFVGRPHIVVGRSAPVAPRPIALPPNATTDSSVKSSLYLDVALPFSAATDSLKAALIGTTVAFPGGKGLTIKAVEVYPCSPLVCIAIEFGGSARGKLYLEGKPTVDRDTLRILDLAYTTATKNLLVRSYAWLAQDALVKRLQSATRTDLRPYYARARADLAERLKAPIADGTLLPQLVVDSMGLDGVYPTATGIVARIRAFGQLSLTMQRTVVAKAP